MTMVVCDQYQFLYCIIPKNCSMSIKNWIDNWSHFKRKSYMASHETHLAYWLKKHNVAYKFF